LNFIGINGRKLLRKIFLLCKSKNLFCH